MRKSLLVASLMVITESVFGIHDHPLINRSDRTQQTLTPISNVEATSDRSSLNGEMSDIGIIDEGNYSGASQGQNSSESRKRKKDDKFTDFMDKVKDKRKRLVTLQDTINSLKTFPNKEMSNEEKVRLAEQIISVTLEMDDLKFFGKSLQSRLEVNEYKEFMASLSKVLGYEETKDYSTLFDYVKNSMTKFSKLEKNSQKALQQINELNQQSKSYEEKINKQKEKIDSSRRAYQELSDKYNQLKENFNFVQQSRKRHKQEAEILKTNLEDLSSNQEHYEHVLQQNNDLILSLARQNSELNDSHNEQYRLSQLLEERNSENDRLNRSLEEHVKELNIFKFMNEINVTCIKNLSANIANLADIKDRPYLKVKLNNRGIKLRRDVYHLLQELREKEQILERLLTVEKDLKYFLNTVILYKENKSLSPILEKMPDSRRKKEQVYNILNKELSKQEFKKELKDLFDKKYKGIAEDFSYAERTENYRKIYEFIRAKEQEKDITENFYIEIGEETLYSIDDMKQLTEKVAKGIDEKIAIIRKLREEEVIKDFFEKMSKIDSFKSLMNHVDNHLNGNYEALLRVRMYEYDRK